MDEARKKTDRKLRKMEKKVNNIYEEAYSDISEKWNKFMDSHYPKLDRAIQNLKEAERSGDAAAIKEAKDVYERTAKNIVVNNRRFSSMAEETAAKISHTNEIALAYVNDQLPAIYSLNYNAFGEEKIKGYSFSLVNESAVKELAQSDKTLLPKKKLDIPKDMQWNKKLINSQMMQSILQGENIPTMAKRLMNVTDMNRVSAIRNARTMTTAAENKGRQDSFKKAVSDGVIMKRIWVATTDERTRAWHRDLDGVAVNVDEPWENDYGEIMFPGDPTADPANVYNCRCSIRAHVEGFRWNKELEEQSEEESRYVDLSDMKYNETTEWFDENSNLQEWKERIEDLEYDEEIYGYTGEYFGSVNNYLRTDKFYKSGFVTEEKVKSIVEELDESISGFELNSPIKVYRASGAEIFGSDDLSFESLRSKIGETVHDNAFLSTSTLKQLPGEQTVGGRIKYEINIPEGKGQGAYIASFSENAQEREFLVARDGDYLIRDVFKDKDDSIHVSMDFIGVNKAGHLDKNGLTLKEQAEIMSYKSFDYYTINDTLREKGFDALTDLQKEKVLTLDSALKKLPTYSGDVSRSLYFNDEDDLQNYINEVQKRGKLDSPAYLSTTKNIDELYNPDGQVQIYIDDSKRGRDLRDYDNGENEVLYERNSKIDIVEQGWEDGVYVIKAKERR